MDYLQNLIRRQQWRGIWLMLAIVAGCGKGPSPSVREQFQAAQESFNTAKTTDDYLRSAALFQEVLDDGFVSGAVYYNQGNAFARAQQRGRAIACYRQALRYQPRDAELRANLEFVLSEAGVQPVGDESIWDNVLFWQSWWGYTTKFRASLLSGFITFALALITLYWRRWSLKVLAIVGLAATLLLSGSAVLDWYRFTVIERGVIVEDAVVARKGNGESYQPAFDQALPEGTEFRVIGRRGDWLHIRLSPDEEGWIPKQTSVSW